MQQKVATKREQPPAPLGVVEAIADGLSIVLVRPWLFLLPMLVDLWFWVGYRVTGRALVEPVRRWLIDTNTTESLDFADRIRNWSNLDISWLASLLVPTLLGGADRDEMYTLGARPIWAPGNGFVVSLLIVLAVLGAALALSIFSVPLADAATGRTRSVNAKLRAMVIGWLRVLGLFAVAVGIALLMAMPLLVGWIGLMFAGVNAAPLVGFASFVGGIALYIALWFAPDSIFVNEVGPLRSIYFSIAVVRAYFWQTLGFVSASFLLTVGLGEIWTQLAVNPPGLLLGVIMNAFFATGVAIASMVFFATRIRSLKPESVR